MSAVNGFDDLQQILGYLGTEPDEPDDALVEVAAETYLTSCWNPRFCATVIRAAEAVGAFEPNEDDPVPGHEVSLAVISPALFEAFQHDVGTRIFPRLRTVWPYITTACPARSSSGTNWVVRSRCASTTSLRSRPR
jgi:hypothetical protein